MVVEAREVGEEEIRRPTSLLRLRGTPRVVAAPSLRTPGGQILDGLGERRPGGATLLKKKQQQESALTHAPIFPWPQPTAQ
jgi:hypothetical protein